MTRPPIPKKPLPSEKHARAFPGFYFPTTKFYFQNKKLPQLLGGIQRFQQRDDMGGKFARKLGQQRRAILAALEDNQAEQNELLDRHKQRYPDGHELAGQPTPVYATKEDGSPLYKQDSEGKDTEERVVKPNEFNLADREAWEREATELMNEFRVIECPAFSVNDPTKRDADFVPELDTFKKVHAGAFDILMDLEEGSPATIEPTGAPGEENDDDDSITGKPQLVDDGVDGPQ